MGKKLSDLLEGIHQSIDEELRSRPAVVQKKPEDFDVAKLPIQKREWHRLDDVVAVAVDLKGSSKMGTGKHAASTASIYEASTGNAVRALNSFEADFIQIQGDGAFGLFWGDKRIERALCAGITVKTFSEYLTRKIDERWPDAPSTGYKVGIARGRVLAKRVGTLRNVAEQEPIWSGKPVNYAVKAAQSADAGELIVTAEVWAKIESNHFLTHSCGHNGGAEGRVAKIWETVSIKNLPEGSPDGRRLRSVWCATCGESFCDSVLKGERFRDEVMNEVLKQARGVQDALHSAHLSGLAQ